MLAYNVTPEQLHAAAVAVGVDVTRLRAEGRGWRFVLRTHYLGRRRRRSDPPARYKRHSTAPWARGRTVPGAVCWHGHRDFMRALYKLAPSARLRTTLATYNDAAHFEATFPATQHNSAGGPWASLSYAHRNSPTCHCSDEE